MKVMNSANYIYKYSRRTNSTQLMTVYIRNMILTTDSEKIENHG